MIDVPHLMHIQSATMEPCSLTKDAYAEAQRTWLCKGCLTPRRGLGAINVQLDTHILPAASPLNFAVGTSVPIARRKFLFALSPEVIQSDLHVGTVLGPSGETLKDWVTFRGRHRVAIRGSKNVAHRICSECGRDVYFAMGDRYLYPEPPSDAAIYESDLCGLVVRTEILRKILIESWPGLTVEELPVLTTPKDSLGVIAA